MGEIKQANFRVDTETADKFRGLCEELGMNQAQGFDHVMQVVELNRAKTGVEGRLTEITTFEEYIKKVMEAYILSLKIAQNTEELVREDFKTDIMLRDRALTECENKILERDEKISRLSIEIEEAKKVAQEAVKTTENATKQAESAQKIAEEKEKVNGMLSAKLAEAEEKLAGYDDLKVSKEELQKRVVEMQHQIEMLQVKLQNADELNKNISVKLKTTEQSLSKVSDSVFELKSQIKLLERDVEEQKRINEHKLSEQARESQQAQEIAVQKAVSAAEKAIREELTALRDDKIRLEVELKLLKNKDEQ